MFNPSGGLRTWKNDEKEGNLIGHDEKQKHSFNEIQISPSK